MFTHHHKSYRATALIFEIFYTKHTYLSEIQNTTPCTPIAHFPETFFRNTFSKLT